MALYTLFVLLVVLAIAAADFQSVVDYFEEAGEAMSEYFEKIGEGAFFNYTDSTCVCTTVPCPVVGKNYLKVGDGATAEYTYIKHNGHAVVENAKVTLTPDDLDHGCKTTTCTQEYARILDDDGKKDCDAGHIIAHRLGGPGNQPINIFPQASSLNRGPWEQFEKMIYECLSNGADKAALSYKFKYASTKRTKPDYATYSAKFTGGDCPSKTTTFSNQGN